MGPTVQHTNLKVHNYDSLCVALCAAQALCSMIISLILHGNAAVLGFDSQLEVLRGTLCLRGRPSPSASTASMPAGGDIPTSTYECKHCGRVRRLCTSLATLQRSSGSDFRYPTFCFDCSRLIPAGDKDLPAAQKLVLLSRLSPMSRGGGESLRAALSPSVRSPGETPTLVKKVHLPRPRVSKSDPATSRATVGTDRRAPTIGGG
jgi:hypothetical protein